MSTAAGGVDPPEDEPVARRRFSVGGPFHRREWAGLAGVTMVYLLLVVLAVRRGPPLGWDESVYALRAADFASGSDPGWYWRPYRAPGLSWVGSFALPTGHEVLALRVLVACFGLALVAAVWLLARHLFGRRAGLVAAAGTALTPPLLLASTQVWPDVPGAFLGLAAIALFVFATGGDRPSWGMLAVPVLVTLATLVRFGAPLPIAVGLLVVAIWRHRVLTAGPVPVLITAIACSGAVAAILAVPWVNGPATSPLRAVGELMGRPFQGLADYAQAPGSVAGPAAVVVGLVGLIAALARARPGAERSAVLTVTSAGLATALALAVVLHGEVRYLAPAYPWLWVGAAPGLVRLGAALPGRWAGVAAGVLVLGLAASAVGAVQDRNGDMRRDLASVAAAAGEVTDLADGESCMVIANRVPQLAWYSGCEARPYNLEVVGLPAPSTGAVFMVLVEGDPRQPEGELLADYLAVVGEPVSIVEGWRDVFIYRVGDPVSVG